MTKHQKGKPTRRQAFALAAQRANGERLRSKLQQKWNPGPPETDQVVEKVRPIVVPEYVAQHTDFVRTSRQQRRRYGRSTNQPYVNPGRDTKSLKSGRLRKELR